MIHLAPDSLVTASSCNCSLTIMFNPLSVGVSSPGFTDVDENVFSSVDVVPEVVTVVVVVAVADFVVVVISNFSVLSVVDGLFFFFVPLCL